jgi:hypothetical protein
LSPSSSDIHYLILFSMKYSPAQQLNLISLNEKDVRLIWMVFCYQAPLMDSFFKIQTSWP